MKIVRDYFMERAHRTRSIIIREIFVLVRGYNFSYGFVCSRKMKRNWFEKFD